MATFPRNTRARPRLASPWRFPEGLMSWGDSGKGQFRAIQNMGRVWTETYPVLDTDNPNVRQLLEAINRSLRERVIWDVQHPYLHVRKGAGGGSPLVNGADQTGSILVLDGGSNNITNWLLPGDILQVAGMPVVFDCTTACSTNGSGQVSVPIHPPIFQGRSPADNAAVEIIPANIFFKAVIMAVDQFPDMDVTKYIDAGLTITWREQPQ